MDSYVEALRVLALRWCAVHMLAASAFGLNTAALLFAHSCVLQFCKAVRWELYCDSKSSLSKVARGLITGFLPSLLITLWQVRAWM
jgi:hypothetical protein